MQAPASPAETKTVHSGQSSFTASEEADAGRRRRRRAPAAAPGAGRGCRPSRPSTGPASGGGDRAGRGDRAARGRRSPVSSATSSTQPRPTIDSGSRPMNAASTIGRACGVRSTCR